MCAREGALGHHTTKPGDTRSRCQEPCSGGRRDEHQSTFWDTMPHTNELD